MQNWLKHNLIRAALLALPLAFLGAPPLAPAPAAAQDVAQTAAQEVAAFTVEDIRIEGLRRFSPGVIFNRLPVGIGDSLQPDQVVDIIADLYETGYFREVELLQDGNVLVVKVEENPTVAEVTVSGATELSDTALENMLDSAGIAKSKVFNQSIVEEAARVIENVYIERNFYHANVEAVASPLPRNRVAILFKVDEGTEAAIRSIRILGNEAFSTWRLKRDMRLEPRSVLNFFTDNYRFSEQKLEADLGRIRTRYLEAGYLRFEVEARQVQVSPDKKSIDIFIRLNEGRQYNISDIRFELAPDAEPLPVGVEEFEQYITQEEGEIYSGRAAGNTVADAREHLFNLGYANASASQDTLIDDETGEVEIVYTVDPKHEVYIRQINIVGNEITADEIIRRELLVYESERYSSDKIRRSRSRVRRLGYFNRVQIDTVPVEGNKDQVDLLVSVEEAYTGEVTFGAGFGSSGGLSYNAGFSNTNIFGSGNDFAANFSKSEDSIDFELALDQHYFTMDGVSRHMALTYGKSEAGKDSSAYSIDGYKGEFGFDFPFTDDGTYNLYLAYQQVDINSVANSVVYQPFIDRHGEKFNSLLLESGLNYDTRDAASVPTEGNRIDMRGQLALPVLELEYYFLDYMHDFYYTADELPTDPVFHASMGAGYGDSYGDGEYPFYRRYFLGGANTLRGFASNSIGYADDASGNAIGGKSRLFGALEMSADSQLFEEQQIFLVPFIDIGAVGQEHKLGSFRSSYGVELRWLSPVGPLRFSYVEILRKRDADDVERFQFAISTF